MKETLLLFCYSNWLCRDSDDGKSDDSSESQTSYDPQKPSFRNRDGIIGGLTESGDTNSSGGNVVLMSQRPRPDNSGMFMRCMRWTSCLIVPLSLWNAYDMSAEGDSWHRKSNSCELWQWDGLFGRLDESFLMCSVYLFVFTFSKSALWTNFALPVHRSCYSSNKVLFCGSCIPAARDVKRCSMLLYFGI